MAHTPGTEKMFIDSLTNLGIELEWLPWSRIKMPVGPGLEWLPRGQDSNGYHGARIRMVTAGPGLEWLPRGQD